MRHREIAEILARIKKLEADEELAAMDLIASPSTPRTPLTSRALNSVSGPLMPVLEAAKVSKKERKAAKKAAKAMERDKVVTTADIELVAKTLHPEPEKDDETDAEGAESPEQADIKHNLRFHNSTCNSKSARHDYIIKEREVGVAVDEQEIERLLSVFEVDCKAIGKEGELVRELVEAIKSDLGHFNDELAIVARNRAGFWRWANKKAYKELVENGKEWSDKHKREHGPSDDSEERRESTLAVDTEVEDDAATSRSGSLDSGSAGTALTVPSSKPSSTGKPASLTLAIPPSKPFSDSEGWTAVGKKVLQPARGTLKLSGNGGLRHLAQKPKDRFGALSWADTVKNE